MNSTINLGNILFQTIKGFPWWFWVIIIVSFIFGGSRKSKSRRNYYKKDNSAPIDIAADKIIDSIIRLFKPQKNNSNIDQMSGRDFEKYLETIFIKLGYLVDR